MLVKEFKPKYEVIEVIIYPHDYESHSELHNLIYAFNRLCKMHLQDFKKEYGDYNIISVMNFEDTSSTSICIQNKRSNLC